jgi:hypothetical protein
MLNDILKPEKAGNFSVSTQMSYFFHPAAEAEYLEAVAYYESKRPGLGATYLTEFERVVEIICEAPHRNPVEKCPDVRRMRMKRFPFAVVYREHRFRSGIGSSTPPAAGSVLARPAVTSA